MRSGEILKIGCLFDQIGKLDSYGLCSEPPRWSDQAI